MRSLVILLDTVRRDFLTCYGNDWVQTPNIARLAQLGTVFDNHYVGSMPCMPARHDLMSGRLEFLHRGWGGLEPFDRSLPRTLREGAGVFSHMATDHYHYFHRGGENYVDEFTTWDFQRGQEGDKWHSLVDRPALPPFEYPSRLKQQNYANRFAQQREEDFSGPRTVLGAVEWLKTNARQDDWFLQLELFDPHEPFYAPEAYLRQYGVEGDKLDAWDWPEYRECEEPPEAVDEMRRRYAALLTMTDRWVGRVLDELERQGVYDDTLIIFTTDHGTHLGDHGYWMKNFMPMRQCLSHIPLVVKQPGGVGAGERCAALTQTPDLYRTLCLHHGAEPGEHSQGVGFLESYTGERRHEAVAFGYHGQAANVTDGRYTYFRNPVAADGQPCYWYYAQPPQSLHGSERSYGAIEHGFQFDFTRGLVLNRMPSGGNPARLHVEAGGPGKHQLHDLETDPTQQQPLEDPEVEARMLGHLKAIMDRVEAPPEQYERLGVA